MLPGLRRWLRLGGDRLDVAPLAAWAREQGHLFRHVRQGSGCVIEGTQDGIDWRAEWGRAQRDFIGALELRLIADVDLPPDLVACLVSRPLADRLEESVYRQYVDTLQTRADTEAPPEMRWLVLLPPASDAELGRLQGRYRAVGSHGTWLARWLASPLGTSLAGTLARTAAEQPVVLSAARGRVLLRTALAEPDAGQIMLWLPVLVHAVREARRLKDLWRDSTASPSTMPAAWAPTPGDHGPR